MCVGAMATAEGASDSPIHVLIVGGGLSGLATAISVSLAGHKATVFEQSPAPFDAGSGVVTCPNGTRLLSRWGVGGPDTRQTFAARWDVCDPRGTALGPDLMTGHCEGVKAAENCESLPPWTFYRPHLIQALLRRAEEVGITARFGARVTRFNGLADGKTSVMLEDNEMHHGDLVVVADGTGSKSRHLLTHNPVNPTATGYIAYRITVDRTRVRGPELLAFMDNLCIRTWAGNGSYVSVYPMRNAGFLSMMVLIPQDQLQQVVSINGVPSLQHYFKDWDPLLSSMIRAASNANKWTAVHLLPERRSEDGSCILVGDAANTMWPFLSQGLSLDLEDAGTLGCLLGHVRSRSQLPAATALYTRIRDARAQRMRDETDVFERQLQTTTGGCRNSEEGFEAETDFRHKFETGRMAQSWMWSYDAYAEAEAAFNSDPF
ncbi:hypothetical protein PG985_003535 [Apiospora marii]|uniref:FAD-binding domain-containing protein n=1 Tax=Apiospora marii TaxID=335849 RepID=A0ABR1SHU3_9PEZI